MLEGKGIDDEGRERQLIELGEREAEKVAITTFEREIERTSPTCIFSDDFCITS